MKMEVRNNYHLIPLSRANKEHYAFAWWITLERKKENKLNYGSSSALPYKVVSTSNSNNILIHTYLYIPMLLESATNTVVWYLSSKLHVRMNNWASQL